MAESRADDLRDKLAVLGAAARPHGVTTLVLRDPATLAWLLECRVHVAQTLDTACLAAVVELGGDAPRLRVVTDAIEAPRLRDTELADVRVDWEVLPWWASRADALPAGPAVGTDRPLPGAVDVAGAVVAARRCLTPRQQALLADVCADTASAAREAAMRVGPSTTEHQAAGRLADALLARGLDPIVLMVGGGTRPGPHRHPLPTGERLGDRAMLVCCARRHGLVASCTRIVSFRALSSGEGDRYRALLEVERAFLDASRPGGRIGDAFDRGAAAYPAWGFAADEWHRHHQGGLTGFLPREFPAHTGSDLELRPGMVVAWNPSGAGWKVEDDFLVTADGARPLATDEAWPTLAVGGRSRPDVLVR